VFAVGPDGKKCAVQCKRYTQSVGPATVRELAGSRELHQCDSALLVTTTSLTTAAEQTAESLGIDVIDGNHLTALHLERISRK
jgi:HJR/Mrr/RecB family endonuclease